MIFKTLTLMCLVALTASCSSLNLNLPSSRLDSPEALGETWKMNLGSGLGATHSVEISGDASQRPPTFSAAPLTPYTDTLFRFSLGFWNRFEMGLHCGLVSTCIGAAKFQLLGDPQAKAQVGNFSLAVTAGYGTAHSSNKGDQQGTFGPGGYNWQASANSSIEDYAAIVGYRVNDLVLLYGGGFLTRYKMSGSIHDFLSDNNLSPAADYPFSATGQNLGGNLDLQIFFTKERKCSITLEGEYSNLNWSGRADHYDTQGSVVIDFFW